MILTLSLHTGHSSNVAWIHICEEPLKKACSFLFISRDSCIYTWYYSLCSCVVFPGSLKIAAQDVTGPLQGREADIILPLTCDSDRCILTSLTMSDLIRTFSIIDGIGIDYTDQYWIGSMDDLNEWPVNSSFLCSLLRWRLFTKLRSWMLLPWTTEKEWVRTWPDD